MRHLTLRSYYLLALGVCTLFLTVGKLPAETISETCLTTPDLSCVDALNSQLAEIEAAITDPQLLATRQMERARILASGGRYDEATALLTMITSPPDIPDLKDEAVMTVIRELGAETQIRGRDLLATIQSPDIYEVARAHYLVNLAKTADFDQLLAEVDATNRAAHPLEYFAIPHLLAKAVAVGQTDAAIRLIETHTPDTPEQRGPNFNMLVQELAKAGKLDDAEQVVEKIQDPEWLAISSSELAAAFAKAGNPEKSTMLFTQAREEMSFIEDAYRRFGVFDRFAEAAIDAGRVDLAVDSVRDVGSFPLDVVNSLTMIVRISATRTPEVDWRPIAEEAIALLDESPQDDPNLLQHQDDAWAKLAGAVAAAGDTNLAETLIARIPDKDRQSAELANLANTLIDAGQLKEALAILPSQPDRDIQVQGLIRLVQAAQVSGQTEMVDKVYDVVLGLVEGPEHVEVSDYTISELARYEASIGDYNIADIRLNFVNDQNLQTLGRIINVGSVAKFGTAAELDQYLATAKDAIAQDPAPDRQRSWTPSLLRELVSAGKDDLALAIATEVTDPAIRDELLGALAADLGATRFLPAMTAAQGISSAYMKQFYEHLVLSNALTVALSD